MNRYISLLREINVSGTRIIKMDELASMYESPGLKKIITYIQSWNVIVDTAESDVRKLEKLIENQIKRKFKFDVPVIIRTAEKINQLIKNNPFKDKEEKYIYCISVG